MDAALSFDRVWVRLVASRPEGTGLQQRKSVRCKCLESSCPEVGSQPDSCSSCIFVAAEVGATETVADLKGMLLELLPSCFHTHYDLILRRRKPGQADCASWEAPLLLQDSYSIAELSIKQEDVIDLVPRKLDARSALLHLRRLTEVLYDPSAIVMKQLPDASDPCGAFGAFLRPVVLQQLATTAEREAYGSRGENAPGCEPAASPAVIAAVKSQLCKRNRSSRRRLKRVKGRLRTPVGSVGGGDFSEEHDAEAARGCSLFSLHEEVLEQQEQHVLLLESLVPSPLTSKPKLLSFINVFSGGSPTPAAQLAGHVLWIEAETLEKVHLFITATEKGFCVSSQRRAQADSPGAAILPSPLEAFPLHSIAAPDGQSLLLKEAETELLFDTLAQLLCAYSEEFANGISQLAPARLDADLPLHAMPSLQPFLPPFAAKAEAAPFCYICLRCLSWMQHGQAGTFSPLNVVVPVPSAPRLWVAEASMAQWQPLPNNFTQRIACEKQTLKVLTEFREAALLGAVALRERRLVPLGSCHVNRRPMPGAPDAANSAHTPSTPKRHSAYVHNNILLIPNTEPLSCSSCSAETFLPNAEADMVAREALRKAAEAAEVARMCEDEAVAAAAAAAAASSVASVVGPGAAWCYAQRSEPGIPLAVIVDYAGSRVLCQGVHEDMLKNYCFPDATFSSCAEVSVLPEPQEMRRAAETSAGVSRLLGVKHDAACGHAFKRLCPLDILACPLGFKQTPSELAAAAAVAAARHAWRRSGEAASAAAVAATAATDAELHAAAAAAGLTQGSSHATSCPALRPELVRAYLAFKSRQVAIQEQQQQQHGSTAAGGSSPVLTVTATAKLLPFFENELQVRWEEEMKSCCTNSPKELLRAVSWFGNDSKGGSNGYSLRLQKLQELTLECCTETVLRCMERAREQQKTLLTGRRADIEEFRAAVERKLEQRDKERQQHQQVDAVQHQQVDSVKQHLQQETGQQRRTEADDIATKTGATASAAAAPAAATAVAAASAAGAASAATAATALKRKSDVAMSSSLGDDVSLLQNECNLSDCAASLAAKLCASAFPRQPGVPIASCLSVDGGTGDLPLDSKLLSTNDRDNLLHLAEYLRQVAIPLAAKLLSAHYPGCWPPLDSRSLKMFLHRYGLSCRHMGAVFRAVKAINPGVAVSLPLLLLERDILLRCAKSHINRHLATLTLGEVAPAAAHLISCLFHPFLPSSTAPHGANAIVTPGAAAAIAGQERALRAVLDETPEAFWDALRRRAWTRFGMLLPSSPLHCSALQSVEGRLVLLRSLCAALGVQIRAEVTGRLQQCQPQQQQKPKWMRLLQGNGKDKWIQPAGGNDPGEGFDKKGNFIHRVITPEHQDSTSELEGPQQRQQRQPQGASSSCGVSWSGCVLVDADDILKIVPVLKLPHPPSQVARALLAAASQCNSAGCVDASLDLLQQALCVAHQLSGVVCSEAATCYAATGQLLGLLDDPLNACNNLQKSLILVERSTGPDHPSTIEIHSALAHGFSRLPGSVYRMRSLGHMQRAILLFHTWSCGLAHPVLPLMLLTASRCVLYHQQQILESEEREHLLEVAARCAKGAEAVLEELQGLSPEYAAERLQVYCELSGAFESVGDWRKALEWARAARREYTKVGADAATMQEAEARLVRLARALVMHAQQQRLQGHYRSMLVSRLRQAAELMRTNNRDAAALLACVGS